MQEFNRAPYFDDYDPSSNYLRVLFKDGANIQTREINNMQGIMQNQIRSFGDHIFKNGSRVSNARASTLTYDYVIPDGMSSWDGLPFDFAFIFEGVSLFGTATQLKATVVHVEDANSDSSNYNVMYVVYHGTAIDGETKTFIPGETIQVLDSSGVPFYSFNVPCQSCVKSTAATLPPIGKGSIFTIDDGVFFFNGMFVENVRQKIVVSYYKPVAYYKEYFSVGFEVVESIVTHEEDTTLLDNSLGYQNLTAPGADRYKVELKLARQFKFSPTLVNFIKLATFAYGKQVFEKADSEYSEIEDELARRTYEESGDYYVKPYSIRFIEHKSSSVGSPDGFDPTGSDDNFVSVISPGISYVRGFRHETTSEGYVISTKARDTKTVSGYIKKFDELTSIQMIPAGGTSAYPNSPTIANKVYDGSIIEMYDGVINDLGGGSFLPTGSVIGTMKVFDVSLVSGTPGSGSAVYKYYIYDVAFNEGKDFSHVKSVFHPTNKFIAVPVINGALNVQITNPGRTELVWKIEKDNIKSLRDHIDSNKGSITIYKRAKLTGTVSSQGKITFNAPEGEMFVSLNKKSVAVLTTDGIPQTVDLAAFTVDQSPTSITIDLTSVNAGKDFMLLTDSIITKTLERSKKLLKSSDTVTTLSTVDTNYLSKADVKAITKLTAYPKTSLNAPDTHVDIPISLFTFNNGQTDNSYTNGWIKMTAGNLFPDPVNGNLDQFNMIIEYEYYEHSSKTGVITVDSYSGPIADGSLTYGTIPSFTSSTGTQFPLASCFDFRPVVVGGVVTTPVMPSMGELAIFDVEYYLPRTDLLQIDLKGNTYVKQGIASDNPRPPEKDVTSMALYELWLPAYTYDVNDIKKKKVENKRYTMKDIGKLDQRLQKVEYYTVLNLLEKSASNMSIKDSNGLDRFKNGFIVDNFKDFQAADLSSSEFKASLDTSRAELRPSFTMMSRKLALNTSNSSNFKLVNDLVILPYISVLSDSQPFATKHISINPYHQFTKKGTLTLTPNFDVWSDTHTKPDLVMTQDFGSQAFAGAASTMDRLWGSWRNANLTVNSATPAPSTEGTTTAASRQSTYDLGDRLIDVHVVPYIREATITFNATGLAPNTGVYAFFDNKAVSQFCRQLPNGLWGGALLTDGSGAISGEFKIPAGVFFTGEKKFKLTGSPTNSKDIDTIITTASSTYFAGGIDSTSQGITLNTVTPVLDKDGLVGVPSTKTISTSALPPTGTPYVSPVITGEVDAPDGLQKVITGVSSSSSGIVLNEPIAQSFILEWDQFVTGVDLFFAQVDLLGGDVWVELRTMELGIPTSVVLARREFSPESITISDDSTREHHVEFDFPVFVKANTFYAVVVGGSSPDTRIWVSRVGGIVADNPNQIAESQISLGSSFRSQNGTGWLAEQWEDLKYNIYSARFSESSMNLEFEVVNELEPLTRDSLEFQSGSDAVRIYSDTHAAAVGDIVTIQLHDGSEITLEYAGSAPVIGDIITTATGSAKIESMAPFAGGSVIRIKGLTGSIKSGQSFTWADGSGTITASYPPIIAGILVEDLCKDHIVTAVDGKGSFIITAATNATSTMRSDDIIKLSCNVAYDVMNVSASLMRYNGRDDWRLSGLAHNPYVDSRMKAGYSRMSPVNISAGADIHMSQPFKLVTDENTIRTPSGDNRTIIQCVLSSPDNFNSPVINIGTLSAVLVNNKISNESAAMNVAPNPVGRYVDETDGKSGSEMFKYLTRKIRLTNPAEDLYIIFDAYKDDLAEFDIYYKSQAPSDITDIEALPWIRIPMRAVTSHSIATKIEYEIHLSEAFANTWATADSISSFQVKIVGRSVNSANPPLFGNLRIIALT